MTKMRRFYAIPYVFWLLLFVIAPVLLIIYQSFFDMNGNFSLVNYQSYLGSGKYLIMTLNSVWYAFLITLITLVISYPTAYFLTKVAPQRFVAAVDHLTNVGQLIVKSLCVYWDFRHSWQCQQLPRNHGGWTKADFVY